MYPTFFGVAARVMVFLHVLFACALWSAAGNSSFALQETNSQCQYGTDVSNISNADLRIVATFHSLGINWRPSGISSEKTAYALFRELNSGQEFRRSLDLVYSSDDNEYRGSIVHVKSGTEYEVGLVFDGFEE